MITDTTKSGNAKLWGLPYADVEWTGGLYKERFDTCADSTVPHLQRMFESSDISHVLENFKIAAGDAEGAKAQQQILCAADGQRRAHRPD